MCSSRDIESWSKRVPDEELAANRFAAELLLPKSLIAQTLREHWATIKAAMDISSKFQTSLTAAAVRCVELTDEKCALVVSVNGTVQWCRPSSAFHHFIPLGVAVSPESLTSGLFENSDEREKEGSVPAEAWLSGYDGRSDATVWEDSILLPHYNSVLSIVTVTKLME